jgi:predicted nucleic acid-binding Zn ribbon protein
VLRRSGHAEIALLSEVIRIWEGAVGTHVAAHVTPTAIHQDTLFVTVDEPGWSTEVAFLAEPILSGLQERLGRPVAHFVKARVRGRSGVE